MNLEFYIIHAINEIGSVTFDQLNKFLFDTGILERTDLLPPLAALKEKSYLNQLLTPQGIALELSIEGEEFLASGKAGLSSEVKTQIKKSADKYRVMIRKEQDYLAQYGEQSSGIVPVNLSMRNNDKVILKINMVTNDKETAKKICDGWVKNSDKAYDALWEAIGEGQPQPKFRAHKGEGAGAL
jgi:hypothetical protein